MATAPAIRHAAEMKRIWGTRVRTSTVTVVRPIDNEPAKGWSQHSYGNADDVFGSRTVLTAVASWGFRTAAKWSVATVIWDRRIWSYKTRRWSTYTGDNPHTDHVHFDYLPRWTGTPPGRPVGTGTVFVRDYPLPPRVNAPYSGGWRTVIAMQLWTLGRLRVWPTTATTTAIREAVVAWNRGHGLGVTPWVLNGTWDQWDNWTVRSGNTGQLTRGVQLFLAGYGFLQASQVDGVFGTTTKQAVLRMQQRASVKLTGEIGSNDWRALWFGPSAWAEGDVGVVTDPSWTRPADGQPSGRLEHSWESTLLALEPEAKRTAASVALYSRAIRARTS